MWTTAFITLYIKFRGEPLVSIIIPNKDHHTDLDLCLRAIETRATYRNVEFIIVENNSTEKETFEYYEKIQKEFSNVHVVTWEREFNYSAINNFGVTFAKGEYLLFLNNDTELIAENFIEEMLGLCQRRTSAQLRRDCSIRMIRSSMRAS